jgi:hypothetical protein
MAVALQWYTPTCKSMYVFMFHQITQQLDQLWTLYNPLFIFGNDLSSVAISANDEWIAPRTRSIDLDLGLDRWIFYVRYCYHTTREGTHEKAGDKHAN